MKCGNLGLLQHASLLSGALVAINGDAFRDLQNRERPHWREGCSPALLDTLVHQAKDIHVSDQIHENHNGCRGRLDQTPRHLACSGIAQKYTTNFILRPHPFPSSMPFNSHHSAYAYCHIDLAPLWLCWSLPKQTAMEDSLRDCLMGYLHRRVPFWGRQPMSITNRPTIQGRSVQSWGLPNDKTCSEGYSCGSDGW